MQSMIGGPGAKPRARTPQNFEAHAFPLMDKLYGTALRLTRDRLDAEDLVQSTYLKAWKYFHLYKPGTNFQSWIFKILTNNFINDYRSKKRKPYQEDFETIRAVVPDEQFERTDGFFNRGEIENYGQFFDDHLTAALDKLSEDFRIVVLLADVNEFKYREIADMLDCPVGTVMSRLSRARKVLAKHLKAYAVEHGYVTAPRSSGAN